MSTAIGHRFSDIARGLPVVSVEPTAEPVSKDEAAIWCRADADDDGLFIENLIKAARQMVETDARLALMSQTQVLRLDAFPEWEIELRTHPVVSVSSIVYVATDGTSTTVTASDYRTDIYAKPALVTPAYGLQWPNARSVTNAVTVTFTCGYTSAAAVPQLAKQAMYLLIADWYRNRERVGDSSGVRDAYEETLRRLRWAGDV